MVYGKEFKILINFDEYSTEETFTDELINICKENYAILFVDGDELTFD